MKSVERNADRRLANSLACLAPEIYWIAVDVVVLSEALKFLGSLAVGSAIGDAGTRYPSWTRQLA